MKRKKILIVGGGFGGVYTAKYLHKFAWDICDVEILSELNYFTFQPLLPEVVSGTIGGQDCVIPLRILLPNTKCRTARMIGVDFERNFIQFVQGARRLVLERRYDHLVLAVGQTPNTDIVPGLADHAMPLRTLSDAHLLRSHIIECLEWADVTEIPEIKHSLLTIVVAGGGFSGIETIGEIVEMIAKVIHFYPNISFDEIHAIVLQSGDRILPELHPKLSKYTLNKLKKRNIDIYLNTRMKHCALGCVVTDRGQKIHTRTVISTIGNTTPQLIRSLPLEFEGDRVKTQTSLLAEGRNNVWCVGDLSAIPILNKEAPSFVPPTAQAAVQAARTCAQNIKSACLGKPLRDFRCRHKGALVSLGRYSGAGEIFGLRISGFVAWFVWRGFYILKIPSFTAKIRITLNWLYDYIFPRTITCVPQSFKPVVYGIHIQKGDIFLRKNQILAGIYKIIRGRLEMNVENPDGTTTRKELKQDVSISQVELENEIFANGEVRALENSYIMVFRKEDYLHFKTSFPDLLAVTEREEKEEDLCFTSSSLDRK